MRTLLSRHPGRTGIGALAAVLALTGAAPASPAPAQAASPDLPAARLAAASPPGTRASGRDRYLRGALGLANFGDEAFIDFTVGGSVRLPLAERWSIEPEFIWMSSGNRDHDFHLTANLVYDMQTRGPMTPFWKLGAGLFRDRASFGGETHVETSWSAAAGAGVRIGIAERWAAVAEALFGVDPIVRASGGLSYSF